MPNYTYTMYFWVFVPHNTHVFLRRRRPQSVRRDLAIFKRADTVPRYLSGDRQTQQTVQATQKKHLPKPISRTLQSSNIYHHHHHHHQIFIYIMIVSRAFSRGSRSHIFYLRRSVNRESPKGSPHTVLKVLLHRVDRIAAISRMLTAPQHRVNWAMKIGPRCADDDQTRTGHWPNSLFSFFFIRKFAVWAPPDEMVSTSGLREDNIYFSAP